VEEDASFDLLAICLGTQPFCFWALHLEVRVWMASQMNFALNLILYVLRYEDL